MGIATFAATLKNSMSENNTRFFGYMPVSDDLIKWGLYVTGAGEGEVAPGVQYPPQDHPPLYSFKYRQGRVLPEYQIVYITEGSGTFESKPTGKVAVTPGTIFLLFPDVWHTYRPNPKTGWTEHWVSLNGNYIYYLAEQKIISPQNAVMHPGVKQPILKSLKKLISNCLLYTSPSPRDGLLSRMPSSA